MMALKQLLPPRDICAITCYGAIYSYDNKGNLLSLSREGDIVGPFVVNDVSGGCEDMWRLLGQLQLPYIAMHTRGTPKNVNLTYFCIINYQV